MGHKGEICKIDTKSKTDDIFFLDAKFLYFDLCFFVESIDFLQIFCIKKSKHPMRKSLRPIQIFGRIIDDGNTRVDHACVDPDLREYRRKNLGITVDAIGATFFYHAIESWIDGL